MSLAFHKHTHTRSHKASVKPQRVRRLLARCFAALKLDYAENFCRSSEENAPSLPVFYIYSGAGSVVSGQRELALWGHLDTRGERPYRQTTGTAVPEKQASRSDASVMLI